MSSLLFIVVLQVCLVQSQQVVIHVAQNESSCQGTTVCVYDVVKALQSVKNKTTVYIHPGQYILSNSSGLVTFNTLSDIVIQNYGTGKVEMVCVTDFGLTFIDTHNIKIAGLIVQGCGELYNSTSKNFKNKLDLTFLKFYSTFYFLSCSNVTFDSNIVRESRGIAIQYYAVQGVNTITDCEFIQNPLILSSTMLNSKGGGVYVEFPYCWPGNISCKSPVPSVSHSYYLIKSNRFQQNFAKNQYEIATFILPHETDHDAFGRGGGLSVYFKGICNNNIFNIENNTFIENHATFGGGLFVEFQDSSYNNSISINAHNIFTDNTANKSGGGAHISFFSVNSMQVLNNSIAFDDTIFISNTAQWGGGISFEISRERDLINASNSITFNNCQWKQNNARLGSAVDLSLSQSQLSNTGAIANVVMAKCIFTKNSVISNPSEILGYGVLYANSIPVEFHDRIEFKDNFDGSALVATNNIITFASNTSALFFNNTGRDGAAIALLAFSYIIVHENTSFNFTSNKATNEGGAIFAYYAGGRNLVSSRNCFIRYCNIEKDPQKWRTTFYFDSNEANGKRNSIFSTSVLPCVWGRIAGPDQVKDFSKHVFCWNKTIWQYLNSSCSKEILTDPGRFNYSSELIAIPGKVEPLYISATDDQNKNVTSFLVLSAHSDSVVIDKRYKYISSDSIVLHKKTNADSADNVKQIIVVESEGPRVIRAKIEVKFLECPPGFGLYLESNAHVASAYSCKCPSSLNSYHDYVICYNDILAASILRGYWIGQLRNNTVVGLCKFCKYTDGGNHIPLPKCFEAVQDKFCGETREGPFCSQCKEGFAPAVNSYDYDCVKCSSEEVKYTWILFILLKMLLPFSLFLVLYIFNFSVTSGLLNGPIFFAQILTTAISLDAGDTIPNRDILRNSTQLEESMEAVYIVLYSVWNLEFCNSCFKEFCLHPKINHIHLLLIEYSVAFLPFLMVMFILVIYWVDFFKVRWCVCVFIRCPQKCPSVSKISATIKANIKNGLVAFIVLSYAKIAVITSYLLAPTPIYGSVDNHKLDDVLLFDGRLQFFGHKHRMFALPVLFISSIFLLLIPLVLIINRYDSPERKGGFINHILKQFQHEFRDGKELLSNDNNTQQDTDTDRQTGRQAGRQAGRHRDRHTDTQTERQTRESSSSCCHCNIKDEKDIGIRCGCYKYEDKIKYKIKVNHKHVGLSCKVSFFHGLCGCFTSWSRHDFRWVAGGYMILRLFFLLCYICTDNYMVQYHTQMLLSILAGLFFLVFHPYKKQLHNVVDGCLLLLLAVVISFSMYQYYLTIAGLQLSLRAYIIQYILVFLPAFWIAGCVLFEFKQQKIFKKIKNAYHFISCKRYNHSKELDITVEATEDSNLLVQSNTLYTDNS